MDTFIKFGSKIGNQKHMSAIRDGFALILPLIMAGAIATLINNVFFLPWSLIGNYLDPENAYIVFTNNYIAPWFGAIDAGTLSLQAVAIAISLAYVRGKAEGIEPISVVVVTLGSFFILQPFSRVNEVADYITNYFGAMGLFVGLIVGLLAAEIFIFFMKKGWTIKMPEMVPPAVGQGFAAIIPGMITLLAFATIPWIFGILTAAGTINPETDATNIFAVIENVLQSTLFKWLGGSDTGSFLSSVISLFSVTILQTIFWFFGLHGANMLNPVLVPIWGTFDTMNLQEFAATGSIDGLFPWTQTSWTIYVNHGGSGATLGLLIAAIFANKRPDSKEIFKISAPSAAFQINEPVIFGIPMVLNPIYAIPFILTTPILTVFSYTMVILKIASPTVNTIPWTTPPVLGAALATNFHIGSILVSIITIVLATLIYYPFVLLSNKQFAKEQNLSSEVNES